MSDPNNPYANPPQPGPYGGGQAPYGYQMAPPDHPSATTALVLGIVALAGGFVCGLPILAAPFAWATGSRVVKEIDADPGRYGGRDKANAGKILGIIGSALIILALLAVLVLVVVLAAASTSGS